MNQLITTLLSNGQMSQDTVITAKTVHTTRYGGINHRFEDYLLTNVVNVNEMIVVMLRELNGTRTISASINDITAIDGMSLDRFADVYNINSDGTARQIGRKRGRKPKIQE